MAMGYDAVVVHKAKIVHISMIRKNMQQEITHSEVRNA